MNTIIKGGTLVTDSESVRADLVIAGEKIHAVGKNLKPYPDTRVIDARGKLVMPGAIDVHVHLQLPFCGTVSADDFENGTKAGACGGLTTVVDYAFQVKGSTMMKAIEARRAEAEGRVCIDYALHGGITDWNEQTRREMRKVIDYGIPTMKMFMIYKSEGWMADDGMLFCALEETAKNGATIMVHAESIFVLDMLIARYSKQKKKVGAYGHTLSRPFYTESEAVTRAVQWAEFSGGRLYIVHMSAGRSADAVKAGQERGVKVWAETCPQYLLLDDSVFRKKNGHRYATCPQIKKKEDAERLWRGIRNGELSIVSTDTCTFNTRQKAMWKGDFTKIPFGLPGVETMAPLLFTFGVGGKKISLQRFVELVSSNPARLHGMFPEKGSLAVGTDADIAIWDPKKEFVIRPNRLQTNCDWSPFDGWRLKGYPVLTISRGKIVAENGKFIGKVGHGKFVKRSPGGWIDGVVKA